MTGERKENTPVTLHLMPFTKTKTQRERVRKGEREEEKENQKGERLSEGEPVSASVVIESHD